MPMPPRPVPRKMQPFRQQQSQALRPAVQPAMQQPMQRPMQQRAQPMQSMQQPMQQQMMQKSPMVQRPQAVQPTQNNPMPFRAGPQQMPPKGTGPFVPSPIGGQGTYIPGTNAAGMPSRPGGNELHTSPGFPIPGGNELASTGQQGMPKYDPRGIPGGGYSGGIAGPSREQMAREEAQQAEYYKPGGGKDQAYAAEKQRQLDAGREQREGALFNPPPPQKPVLQPGEVDMPVGHFGMIEKPMQGGGGMQMEKPMQVGGGGVGMNMLHNPNDTGMTMSAFKRGGKVAPKKYAKGGTVKSTPVKASSRGDGIAQRGKTKGRIR